MSGLKHTTEEEAFFVLFLPIHFNFIFHRGPRAVLEDKKKKGQKVDEGKKSKRDSR